MTTLEAAPASTVRAVDGLVSVDARRALLVRVARLLPVLRLQSVARPGLPQLDLSVLATERLERVEDGVVCGLLLLRLPLLLLSLLLPRPLRLLLLGPPLRLLYGERTRRGSI